MQDRLRNYRWEIARRKAEEAGAWRNRVHGKVPAITGSILVMHLKLNSGIPSLAVSCFRKQFYNSLSGCVFLSSAPDVSI